MICIGVFFFIVVLRLDFFFSVMLLVFGNDIVMRLYEWVMIDSLDYWGRYFEF